MCNDLKASITSYMNTLLSMRLRILHHDVVSHESRSSTPSIFQSKVIIYSPVSWILRIVFMSDLTSHAFCLFCPLYFHVVITYSLISFDVLVTLCIYYRILSCIFIFVYGWLRHTGWHWNIFLLVKFFTDAAWLRGSMAHAVIDKHCFRLLRRMYHCICMVHKTMTVKLCQ